MTLVRIYRSLCLVGVFLSLGAAYACSLNPQPLPPGDTAEGGKTTVGTDASTFGANDGAGALNGDATSGGGEPDTGSPDAVAAVPSDGGEEAGDTGAGDTAADGPEDSGAVDAPGDGEEGGG